MSETDLQDCILHLRELGYIVRRKLKSGRRSRFSEDQVRAIRAQLQDGVSVGKVAKLFNTSSTNICHIKSGKTYRHVK